MIAWRLKHTYLPWYQVLHKEYKTRTRCSWSSMLFKHFRRKKDTSEEFSSSSLVKLIDSNSTENAGISEKDSYKPAVEAVSLEIKQQELDGR